MRSETDQGTLTYTERNKYSKVETTKTYDYLSRYLQRLEPSSTVQVGGKYVHPTQYFTQLEEYSAGVAKSDAWGETYAPAPHYSTLNPPSAAALDDINNVFNSAIVSAGSPVANFGESLAEAKSVYQQFGDAADMAIDLAKHIKRRDVAAAFKRVGLPSHVAESWTKTTMKNVRTEAQFVSNAYLGTMFGWMPVLSDLWTGLEVMSNKFKDPYKKGDLVKGYANDSDSDSVDTTWSHPYSGVYGANIQHEVSKKCRLTYYMRHQSMYRQLNRLGLANPVKTAFDMSRLSFMLNWLLPIGDYLAAHSATRGLSFIDGYCSVVIRSTISIDTGDMRSGGNLGRVLKTAPTTEFFQFKRHAFGPGWLNSIPRIPSARSPFEDGKGGVDMGKMSTALAIAVQRFS